MSNKKLTQKKIKDKQRRLSLQQHKLVFVVGVAPVLADFLYDLNLEQDESDFKQLHDLIRKIDEALMQPPVDLSSKLPEDLERIEGYKRAVETQILIQRKFRQFYKDLCNETE